MESSAFSVVVPTYNEADGIEATLRDLHDQLIDVRKRFDVELLVVDDGSTDGTVEIVRRFARETSGAIVVVEHERNAGLVAAMRTGAERALHTTIVFLDADLSYRPEIVERLVAARRDAGVAAAIASPYMDGGYVANVPFVRLIASRGANWILARCAFGRCHTFTGMVRAYDRARFVDLFATAPAGEFNAWALAMFVAKGLGVVEIPAALVWPAARVAAPSRLSARTLWKRTLLVLETARIVASAFRLAERRAGIEAFVPLPQPNGPCRSET